ncbi:hypothetical protein [Paracoccus zhejiangensis]|uniref:hypothetical protein n=1 Tax=Paracoccus zhejiangensis TaxID=1077935 RepID=UPI00130009E0|nr:hypothetical protein [Paracoccus zhejiangensis]
MPVSIEAGDYESWLSGDPDQASALIRSFPADRMRIVLQGVEEKADRGSVI